MWQHSANPGKVVEVRIAVWKTQPKDNSKFWTSAKQLSLTFYIFMCHCIQLLKNVSLTSKYTCLTTYLLWDLFQNNNLFDPAPQMAWKSVRVQAVRMSHGHAIKLQHVCRRCSWNDVSQSVHESVRVQIETLLMSPWWVRIPTRDLTDVTLVN